MILYSVIPAEFVFRNDSQPSEIRLIEADYMGKMVEVMRITDQSFKIVRLIDTDPKAYLNPLFEPGSIVDSRDLKLRQ
jgi:hypothetical protein